VHADLGEYQQLDLRAHSLLADVPLHDIWLLELEGGGNGRTIEDVRRCFTPQTVTTANAAVRMLFALRRGLGRVFGWDKTSEHWDAERYVHRLTDEDRARSLVAPGTDDGVMRIVYVFPFECLSEVRNATVHAFSCFALRQTMTGYRMYWAIYVKPIGPWTPTYMRVIDPFRRAVVYPAVLHRVQRTWSVNYCE
jgi:hypothetical protein